MGHPAGGYMKMVKARTSARGHLKTSHAGTLEGAGDALKPEEERIWHCDVLRGK